MITPASLQQFYQDCKRTIHTAEDSSVHQCQDTLQTIMDDSQFDEITPKMAYEFVDNLKLLIRRFPDQFYPYSYVLIGKLYSRAHRVQTAHEKNPASVFNNLSMGLMTVDEYITYFLTADNRQEVSHKATVKAAVTYPSEEPFNRIKEFAYGTWGNKYNTEPVFDLLCSLVHLLL